MASLRSGLSTLDSDIGMALTCIKSGMKHDMTLALDNYKQVLFIGCGSAEALLCGLVISR